MKIKERLQIYALNKNIQPTKHNRVKRTHDYKVDTNVPIKKLNHNE